MEKNKFSKDVEDLNNALNQPDMKVYLIITFRMDMQDLAEGSREGLCRVEVVGVTFLLPGPLPAGLLPARPSHALRPRPACRRRSPPQLQHLGPGRPCEAEAPLRRPRVLLAR